MGAIYEKDIMITPSRCDRTGLLGLSDTADMCMDIATEHTERENAGINALAQKGLFWIVVKTKIRFFRRPRLTETVTLKTWQERPVGLQCIRDYSFVAQGETLIGAKTQWAVLRPSDGRLVRADGVYPPEMEMCENHAVEEPFLTLSDRFDAPVFASYRVRSTDIDFGNHMNNGAYLHALEGLYSSDGLSRFTPTMLEIHYKKPCYEGDEICFSRQISDGLHVIKGTVSGKTVVMAAFA